MNKDYLETEYNYNNDIDVISIMIKELARDVRRKNIFVNNHLLYWQLEMVNMGNDEVNRLLDAKTNLSIGSKICLQIDVIRVLSRISCPFQNVFRIAFMVL